MLRSPSWVLFWACVRAGGAVAGAAAIVAQLVRTVTFAHDAVARDPDAVHAGHLPTVVTNFFSFFTIQSNVIACVVLAIGAAWLWTKGRAETTEPRGYAVLLACATTYMVTTGIVYNLLLRGVPLPQGTTVPWSNEILHVVVPVVMLLDLLLAPRRRALGWRTVWIVIAYPILWVVYTLVRGPLITSPGTGEPFWYPYPFLNPHNPALVPPGYAGVAVYVAGIAVAIAALAILTVWVGRRRGHAQEGPGAATAQRARAGGRRG